MQSFYRKVEPHLLKETRSLRKTNFKSCAPPWFSPGGATNGNYGGEKRSKAALF